MEKKRIIRMEAMVNFPCTSFKISNIGKYFVAVIATLTDDSRFFIFDHRPQVINLGNELQEGEGKKFKEAFNQPAIVEVVERAGKQSVNLYQSKNKEFKVLFSQIILENTFRIEKDNSLWSLMSKNSPEFTKISFFSLTDKDHQIIIFQSFDLEFGRDFKIKMPIAIGSSIYSLPQEVITDQLPHSRAVRKSI